MLPEAPHIPYGGYMSEEWIHGEKPGSDGKWKDGISIIVNGGKDTLESATIPIEWRLSDALIAKRPQYIVICDHDISQEAFEEKERYHFGRRYIVRVSEFAKYLQLFRAGNHHLVFIVLCGDKKLAQQSAESYIAPMNNGLGGGYEAPINSSFIERGWSKTNKPNLSAYAVAINVELPEGLLEAKPKTPFGKFVWNWSNRYFERGPADECAYRKRKWFAFIPTLVSFLIGRTITGIFLTLYTLLFWLLVAFIGFLPKNPITKIKNAWMNLSAFSWKMVACKYWRRYKDAGVNKKTGKWEKAKHIPICLTPCIALFLIWLPFHMFHLFRRYPGEMLRAAIGTAIVLVIFLIVFGITRFIESKFANAIKSGMSDFCASRRDEVREWWRERPKHADERLVAKLSAISMTNLPVPEKVDIQQVIKKASTPIKFKLGFWVAKSKVCRPFEQ